MAQFIAYLWGGYTAGRMGRGAGVAHGILVPLFALALAAIVAGIATALGAAANVGMPFTETRLPVERDYLIDWGVGIGIGSLVAMFLGGIIGGLRGAAWHTKLETEKEAEIHETFDSREIETVPADREPDETPDETTHVYPTSGSPAGSQEHDDPGATDGRAATGRPRPGAFLRGPASPVAHRALAPQERGAPRRTFRA